MTFPMYPAPPQRHFMGQTSIIAVFDFPLLVNRFFRTTRMKQIRHCTCNRRRAHRPDGNSLAGSENLLNGCRASPRSTVRFWAATRRACSPSIAKYQKKDDSASSRAPAASASLAPGSRCRTPRDLEAARTVAASHSTTSASRSHAHVEDRGTEVCNISQFNRHNFWTNTHNPRPWPTTRRARCRATSHHRTVLHIAPRAPPATWA